jgi:polyisoprenoid-binding protein YceI
MNKAIVALALFASQWSMAQTFFISRNGQISFFSKTPMENIDAVNNEVTSMLNAQNGELVYAVLVKSFRFERALMEEHFNENYMESTKFPKATFTGKLVNSAEINFKKDGTYPATVEGELTIHGVSKKVTATGNLEIIGDKVVVSSLFNIKPGDYDIKIPSLVADKIAEIFEVKVNCRYEQRK